MFPRHLLPPSSTLKKKLENSSERSVPIYKFVSRYIPGDNDLHIHSRAQLNSKFDVITEARYEEGKKKISKTQRKN
jgi:hypothetical protein